jgi:hypothetical protein
MQVNECHVLLELSMLTLGFLLLIMRSNCTLIMNRAIYRRYRMHMRYMMHRRCRRYRIQGAGGTGGTG